MQRTKFTLMFFQYVEDSKAPPINSDVIPTKFKKLHIMTAESLPCHRHTQEKQTPAAIDLR